MHPQRRSGRIAKELPIILLGTDTTGKVFAEETTTVVLSRHGAGIVSKYRFAPDEVLTLRLAGTAKEAEVRLVGQIGGEPGRYIYGLAFVDSNLEFWPMDFPPPERIEPASRVLTLECVACQSRQSVSHGEIEDDVYAVNGHVLRYCESCGTSTQWVKTRGEAQPAALEKSAAKQRKPEAPESRKLTPERKQSTVLPNAPVFGGDSSAARNFATGSAEFAASAQGASVAHAGSASLDLALVADSLEVAPSAYSGAALETLPAATFSQTAVAEARESPAPAAASLCETATRPNGGASPVASARRPADASGRPVNRRKHMRVKVAFSACVRTSPTGSDMVECQNMSKGGLCFQSKQRYALGATVEIAAPFSPGAPALFVPAIIKRVEPIGDGQFVRYGVAYVDKDSARSF